MRLGNIVESTGLTKQNLMEAVRLGLGAASFPILYSFIQAQLLKWKPSIFAQNTYAEYTLRSLLGVAAGATVNRYLSGENKFIGYGMMGSGFGSAIKDISSGLMNPAAAAVQNTVTAAEASTGEQEQTAATPMGGGLAGFGALRGLNAGPSNDSMLFGVGTPDMRAAGMLHGATVAVEESSRFHGATVAIEQNNAFAGALS